MHGDSFVILMIVFVMFMVMRRRGFGPWTQMHHRMEQEIAELRAERDAPQRGPTIDQVQMLEDRFTPAEIRAAGGTAAGLPTAISCPRAR